MELILWSVICALAFYGLIDILLGVFLPFHMIHLLYEKVIERAHERLKR